MKKIEVLNQPVPEERNWILHIISTETDLKSFLKISFKLPFNEMRVSTKKLSTDLQRQKRPFDRLHKRLENNKDFNINRKVGVYKILFLKMLL